jgi:hypothetical protein
MNHSIVQHYQPMLRTALEARGWQIDQAECPNDLWCVDAWTLTSVWSPVGAQVFLAFEFDGDFYSVAVSREELRGHHDTQWFSQLYLKRGLERFLPLFLDDIDRERDKLNHHN